jgi:hypothetical protein
MGLLWRLFAPKPLKKARRTVRKATHPVHTAVRAATPKSVKRLERAAHPLSLAELKTEDAVVKALRGKRKQRPAPRRADQAAKTAPAASSRLDRRQFTASYQDERPGWMHNGTRVVLLDGDESLEVVGESFHQENLWLLAGATPGERVEVDIAAVLVPEPDNPYDHDAVGVWIDGLKVGHLSRHDASDYQPGLLILQERHGAPIALPGVIVGGGSGGNRKGLLGVFLRHDPADFGL